MIGKQIVMVKNMGFDFGFNPSSIRHVILGIFLTLCLC